MYVALIYLVLSIPVIAMSIFLGYQYGLYGLGIVLVFSIPQFLLGKYLKTLEDKTRTMECSSECSSEHKRVAESWVKKALPDF